jgi:hypothetical protein
VLDALADIYVARAAEISLDPALLHRVAIIGASTLGCLPHNGAVVTLRPSVDGVQRSTSFATPVCFIRFATQEMLVDAFIR